MLCMMEHYTYSGTLGNVSTMGGLVGSSGWGPEKKNLPAQLRPSENLKWE